MNRFSSVHKHHLSFFEIASIFSASIGLPAVIIGQQIAEQFTSGIAICSVLVGNLVLWLIGMAIISMAHKDRTNAIDNTRAYIGSVGCVVFALILIFSFLNWFVLIVDHSIGVYSHLFKFGWDDSGYIRFGAVLGLVCALLSLGSLKLLSRICTVSLPMLLGYQIYAMWSADHSQIVTRGGWGLSLSGIAASVLMIFPGMINLPTVFRYARSRSDSYLGLSLMMILISFFEISFMWMPFSGDGEIHFLGSYLGLFVALTSVYVFIKLVCANLLNIYFASACWELFFPRFEGPKGYAVFGLLGTAAYTFIQISSPIDFMRDLTNCYLTSLGVVLLLAFVTQLVVQHRPRTLEKIVNGGVWFVGCLVATVDLSLSPSNGGHALLLGMGASGLFFLIVIFIEETSWSIKELWNGPDV